MKCNTPVLFIIFNRLDTSEKVLAEIKRAEVTKLYIFCDGGRNENETLKLNEVQQRLLSLIDWPCQVVTNFYEVNKGPRVAVGEAITWFFENEEEGIILEHDCLPHPSFFGYCSELLEKYRNDDRIMHIGGDSFQYGKKYGDDSYYFSRYNHIWGFATWRRAWKYYDNSFSSYTEFVEKDYFKHIFKDKREIDYWKLHFRLLHEGTIVTWDFQWTMNMWMQNSLAIVPQVNLVSNIGFGELSLNTKNTKNRMADVPSFDIGKLKHPSIVMPNTEADTYAVYDTFYPTLWTIGIRKLKRWFNL